MNECSRCGQPLGLISYTVAAWAGEDCLAEATLCASCGGVLGDPQYMKVSYGELEE